MKYLIEGMKIGITIGDPAGIGPELVLKSVSHFKGNFSVYGNKKILQRTAQDLGLEKNFKLIKNCIVDCVENIKFRYGKPDRKTAEIAIKTLNYALRSNPDILITAPIVKSVVKETRPEFIGQTEYLAQFYGVKKFAMVGIVANKRIMLLTTHLPLVYVFKFIKPRNIFKKIVLLDIGLKEYFRINNPKIGVAALNPHSFEFTKGEEEKILKGIMLARSKGIQVSGPLPADSIFNHNFDGFLSIYHDQAFIYLKSKPGGVNWTMGLPIIRLSPLYGAALDIAGKNVAKISGMVNAIKLGIKMFRNKSGVIYVKNKS
ncbi:MAG: 4-hydroxythreonine-4-phosphate dehydrogenase PdxA [candidate division WOR-3 bacterium]